MRYRKRNPPDPIDDLFGLEDLDEILGEDELGNIFKSIAKAAKGAVKGVGKAVKGAVKVTKGAVKLVGKAAKPLAKAIKSIGGSDAAKVAFPGVAAANSKTGLAIASKLGPQAAAVVKAGKAATGVLNKAAKGGFSSSGASSVSAGASFKVPKLPTLFPAKKPAAKSLTSAAKLALAAPVPMAAPAGVAPVYNITVQPYQPPAVMRAAPVARPAPKLDTTDLTAKIEAKFGPQFAAVSEALKRISLQNQATTEHKQIVDKGDFQRKVIDSLKRISAKTK